MGTAADHVTIRDRHVSVPGGDLFVREWRPHDVPASGTPLILLHDSLGCVELWRDLPAQLAHAVNRPVLAYDRLGFGKSSARHAPPSVDFINEEADVYFPAVREALGLTTYALFGHSVGGGMSLAIAAAAPAWCEQVISESAQAFVEARTLDGIRLAKTQFADPAQFAKLARWHDDKARWVLEAWTDTWTSPAFTHWSLDPYLAKVHCPVLVIHGDRDEYGSLAFPRRIAHGVRGVSQLAIIEGCGHVPHREQPTHVLSLITAALTGPR